MYLEVVYYVYIRRSAYYIMFLRVRPYDQQKECRSIASLSLD